MTRLTCLALLVLVPLPASAERFDDKRFPFSFGFDAELKVQSNARKLEFQTYLRDWSKDDNFRAFAIAVSARALAKGDSLDGVADSWLALRKKATVYRKVTVTQRTRTRVAGATALRVEVAYTYAGGRETFTHPDGTERETDAGDLEMKACFIVLIAKGKRFTIRLDSSTGQWSRRAPQLRRVLQTLALR